MASAIPIARNRTWRLKKYAGSNPYRADEPAMTFVAL